VGDSVRDLVGTDLDSDNLQDLLVDFLVLELQQGESSSLKPYFILVFFWNILSISFVFELLSCEILTGISLYRAKFWEFLGPDTPKSDFMRMRPPKGTCTSERAF
jgi:hypothetical protein